MTSIVITVYNGAQTLAVQLEALARQRYSKPWEVVIIDNGSTDNSAEIAKSFDRRIPVLRIVNEFILRGRPFALNAGLTAARGDLILMTDQDDEVGPGWLEAMTSALEQFEMVGCSVRHEKLNPPELHWTQQKNELPRLWFPPYCLFASGTTLGLRRSVLNQVGKFDETLKFVQDTDFCIRAHLKNIELGFVPDAVLHYRRRTKYRDHFQQARSYAQESAILAKRYWPATKNTAPVFKDFMKESIELVPLAFRARSRSGRYDFLWKLGRQIGRTEGLLKYRGIPV
ncbi:MAG: glycosyltransferase [Verrucomicrobiota bacterium]